MDTWIVSTNKELKSRDTFNYLWKTSSNTKNSPINPIQYATKDTKIVDYMIGFWKSELLKKGSIFEIGCNCGVNLNELYNKGYYSLYGVDINREAITLMKERYPLLYTISKIYIGDIYKVLPTLKSKIMDVTFSMATLQHIHPDSDNIFEEIVRITKKYIVTIENETEDYNGFAYPRNYKQIFEDLGCTELKNNIIQNKELSKYIGYTIRMFKINKAN